MPGPYNYPGYTDENRKYFRSFMTPERWQSLAQYGMGGDEPGFTAQQMFHGQSMEDEDKKLIEELLSEMMYQQALKRGGQNIRPSSSAMADDPYLKEARRLSGQK